MSVDALHHKRFTRFILACLVSAIFVLVFFRSLLISLALAALISYLMSPLVTAFSKKFLKNRKLSSVIITFAVFGIFFLLVAVAIPRIYHQGVGLATLLPGAIERGIAKIEPLKSWLLDGGYIGRNTLDSIVANLSVMDEMSSQVRATIEKIWQSTPKVFSGVINLLLVPVLTFYILFEIDKIKRVLMSLVPSSLRIDCQAFVNDIDRTLKGVLKGQVMVAGTLSLLYMLGLGVVGLQFGIAIGAIAGCFRVVPYLDVVVGLALSGVVMIAQGAEFGLIIAVIAVFVVVQVIDGMLITPRIIGDRAGLHPGLVILSVFAFTDWFGLFGVFVVIPTLAVLKVSGELFIRQYRTSSFFRYRL